MARTGTDNSYNDDFGFDSDDSGSTFEGLDLQHYLRILRKFKIPITIFTACITALAAYYAYTATPIYSSTSILLIESQANSPITFEQLVGGETENSEYYQTQYEVLRSRGLAKRVVDKLNLWEHPEFGYTETTVELDSTAARSETTNIVEGAFFSPIDSIKRAVGIQTDTAMSSGGGSVVIDLDNPSQVSPAMGGSDALSSGVDPDFANNADGAAFSLALTADSLGSGEQLTAYQQGVLGNFMSRLTIEPLRKTKLVNISFQSPDPVMAAIVANTVGEEYINSYLDAKIELTTRASLWLNQRLTELKKTLDNSEDRLIAFKQENGLVDVGGSVGRLNEQELLLVTAELAQARSELSSKQSLWREVQSLQGNSDLLGSLPAFQADRLVQSVKIDQGQAQRNLDELRNRYGDRHPRVVDAKSQLATLEVTLAGHVARVAGSVSNDYQLSQQRVAAIEAKLNVGKTEIQNIGTKTFELDALEREVETNRSIYDTFFSRITEAKSADGLEAANARISDYAVPPTFPFKPKKQLIIALAALASLILSVLMAFLYEQMDETVKGTNDVEGRLGMKLLGILPLIKGGLFNKAQKLPLNPQDIPDKNRTFKEAVNTARTAICLDDGATPRKVIVITSSVPGEGKSTASINLAYSLAQLERVLLVDADMRRPTIAKAAGFDKGIPGLSNLITQTVPANQCIVRGAFGGTFDILPSGPMPEQPLELLSSKRFEKILEQLGKHYDRIVIDSAPTQAVSDALVLAKLSDAVVYIIKSHETSIELVKRGTERLRQVNAPIAGALITQVDIDKITAYGGDYYYQGYYDYYGYHDKEDANKKGQKKAGGRLRLSQEELLNIRTDDSDVELDLDYGYGNDEPTPTKSVNAPTQRDKSSGFSAGSANGEEFDMTSRIGEYSSRNGVDKTSTTKLARRIKGDLDIL